MKNIDCFVESLETVLTVAMIIVCFVIFPYFAVNAINPAPTKAIRAEITKESYRYNDIYQILAPAKIDTARVDSTVTF